jgi:hypothetical protein
MSINQIKKALLQLNEYPDIVDYIKTFNGRDGFMYTRETDQERIEVQEKMNRVLDDNSHSGASWGSMLRVIQAILNGQTTINELQEQEDDMMTMVAVNGAKL